MEQQGRFSFICLFFCCFEKYLFFFFSFQIFKYSCCVEDKFAPALKEHVFFVRVFWKLCSFTQEDKERNSLNER